MTTKENDISNRSDEHNHSPNEAEIVVSMAVEKMKQQVQEKIDPVPVLLSPSLQKRKSDVHSKIGVKLLPQCLLHLWE